MVKQLFIKCQVIRARNRAQSRISTYVNNTLCPGKLRKNKLGTLSRMAHTSPQIFSPVSLSGYKIDIHEQIKLYMHYFEFHKKSKCLAYFYSIIGMVGRLPKNNI